MLPNTIICGNLYAKKVTLSVFCVTSRLLATWLLFSSSVSNYYSCGLIWAKLSELRIVPLNFIITLPSRNPIAIYSSFLCSNISSLLIIYDSDFTASSFPKHTNYFNLLVIAIVSPFNLEVTIIAFALIKNSTQLAKSSGSLHLI